MRDGPPNFTAIIILPHTRAHTQNHHIVHLKLTQCYMPITTSKARKKIKVTQVFVQKRHNMT